jgi:hypothetical protein
VESFFYLAIASACFPGYGEFAFLFKAMPAGGTDAGLKLSLPAVTPLLPTTH